MKTVCSLFLLLVTQSPFIVHAQDSLQIDRVWTEYDVGYALVTYTNNTATTYESAVTIRCVALDASGRRLNTNTRSFYVFKYGPIEPGFRETLKIPVFLHGAAMASMSCSVRGR